jgi:hypothetical protein
MLDHDARIVKAGALVPLCKMLLSSLVTTQEYTSGLLRNLVAYNAGNLNPFFVFLHISIITESLHRRQAARL